MSDTPLVRLKFAIEDFTCQQVRDLLTAGGVDLAVEPWKGPTDLTCGAP